MSKKEKNAKNSIRVPREEEEASWVPIIILFMLQIYPVAFFLLGRKFYIKWKNSEIRNFRRYATVIGERPYVQLSEIVRTTGLPESAVRADLQKMIDKGYMGSRAYIDLSTGCVVVDPERRPEEERQAAPDWAREWEKRKAAKQEAKREEKPAEERRTQEQPAPGKNVSEEPAPKKPAKPAQEDEFEKTLREIRELNDRIDDGPVSAKIDRIGEITASIFMFVKQKPDRRDEVHKFMSYYLPTTMKLLESYSLLEKQSYQGENIVAARRDIEKILDQMIPAFEKQLDRLFRADAIDISADIDVLETMMAKDGLTEKEGMTMRMGRR